MFFLSHLGTVCPHIDSGQLVVHTAKIMFISSQLSSWKYFQLISTRRCHSSSHCERHTLYCMERFNHSFCWLLLCGREGGQRCERVKVKKVAHSFSLEVVMRDENCFIMRNERKCYYFNKPEYKHYIIQHTTYNKNNNSAQNKTMKQQMTLKWTEKSLVDSPLSLRPFSNPIHPTPRRQHSPALAL